MPRSPTHRVGKSGRKHLGVGDQGEIGLQLVGMLLDEIGDGLAADFFFAFENARAH